MGGKRTARKPRVVKKVDKKKSKKKTGNKPSSKLSNFHKKYNEYVTKLSAKLDIHPNEASSHLGSAMENAFNGLMLSKLVGNVGDDEYYSMKGDELQATLHPSIGASKKKKCKSGKRKCSGEGKCRGHRKCGVSGKCIKCGNIRDSVSLLNKMARRNMSNKRTFHLTPKALIRDNLRTNMSGVSETRVCETHRGSPLKCKTLRKNF